jgi:hypothetical protein
MKLLNRVLPLSGSILMLLWALASVGSARVDVNVGINIPLPVYVAPAPPPVVVVPNSYVYYVPEIDVDILFYHGYWYRPHEGHWFRSRSYNGPWGHLAPHRVPAALVSLPPGYRHAPPGHQRIPHGKLKKNWSRWERERYWHHHGWDDRDRGGPGGGHGGRGREDRGLDDRGPGGQGFDDRGRGHGGHGHGR